MVDRAGPAHVVDQIALQRGHEFGVLARFGISRTQPLQRCHQGFGDITPAIGTKMAARIGHVLPVPEPVFASCCHDLSVFKTISTNSFMRPASLTPGADSTPLLT